MLTIHQTKAITSVVHDMGHEPSTVRLRVLCCVDCIMTRYYWTQAVTPV